MSDVLSLPMNYDDSFIKPTNRINRIFCGGAFISNVDIVSCNLVILQSCNDIVFI